MYLRSFNRFILISLALLGLFVSSSHAATLDIVGGELFGASNVLVDGTPYDVQFKGGSCLSVFGDPGCNDGSGFLFSDEGTARLASLALLSQVLRDQVLLGNFDSDPTLTNDCVSTDCFIQTPYGNGTPLSGHHYLSSWARNRAFEQGDGVSPSLGGFGPQGAGDTRVIFAVWRTPSQVPIPAAVWLFGTALIGLVGLGKRKTAA